MMAGADFPRLTPGNHRITSPPSRDYNCIAWSAGDTGHWWEPGVYWPAPVAPDDYGIAVLIQEEVEHRRYKVERRNLLLDDGVG